MSQGRTLGPDSSHLLSTQPSQLSLRPAWSPEPCDLCTLCIKLRAPGPEP